MMETVNSAGSYDESRLIEAMAEPDGLMKTIALHDARKAGLLELFRDFANSDEEITDEDTAVLQYRVNGVSESWYRVLEKLSEETETESDEFAVSVATLWMNDEVQRAESVEEVFPTVALRPVADGSDDGLRHLVMGIVAQCSEEDQDETAEAAIKELHRMYIECLSEDLNSIAEAWTDIQYRKRAIGGGEAQTPAMERLARFGREAARQLGNAAVLAVGVAGGIALASLFRRR